MTSLKIPSDAPINVQSAFRDVERAFRELNRRLDEMGRGVTADELLQLRKEINRAIKKPSFQRWVDVFGSNMAPSSATSGYVVGSNGSEVVFVDRRTVVTAAPFTSTSASLADVTGLNFSIEGNAVYIFEFMIPWTSAAATTGINLSINGPAAPVLIHFERRIQTVAGIQEDWQTAYDAGAASPDYSASGNPFWAKIEGLIRNITAGTLTVRAATEVAGSQITVQTRANGRIHRLL